MVIVDELITSKLSKLYQNRKPKDHSFYQNLSSNSDFQAELNNLRTNYREVLKTDLEPRKDDQFALGHQLVFRSDGSILNLMKKLVRGQDEFGGIYEDESGKRYVLKFDKKKTCAQEVTMSDKFLVEGLRNCLTRADFSYRVKPNGKISYYTIQEFVSEPLIAPAEIGSKTHFSQLRTDASARGSPSTVVAIDNLFEEDSLQSEESLTSPNLEETGHIIGLDQALCGVVRQAKVKTSLEFARQESISDGIARLSDRARTELAAALFASSAMGDESVHLGQFMALKRGETVEHITRVDFGARGRFAKRKVEKPTGNLVHDQTSHEYEQSGGFMGIRQTGKNYLTLMLNEPKLHHSYNLFWIHADEMTIVRSEQERIDQALEKLPEDEKRVFLSSLVEEMNERASTPIRVPEEGTIEESIEYVKHQIAKLTFLRVHQMKDHAMDAIHREDHSLSSQERQRIQVNLKAENALPEGSVLPSNILNRLSALLQAKAFGIEWFAKSITLRQHIQNNLQRKDRPKNERAAYLTLQTIITGDQKEAEMAFRKELEGIIGWKRDPLLCKDLFDFCSFNCGLGNRDYQVVYKRLEDALTRAELKGFVLPVTKAFGLYEAHLALPTTPSSYARIEGVVGKGQLSDESVNHDYGSTSSKTTEDTNDLLRISASPSLSESHSNSNTVVDDDSFDETEQRTSGNDTFSSH